MNFGPANQQTQPHHPNQQRSKGMFLVRKNVASVRANNQAEVNMEGLRDATTGLIVLAQVQAVGEPVSAVAAEPAVSQPEPRRAKPEPELAFYRKYTEAMLRRYLRLSMETGRVPSLLGRELFRSRVTSYRVQSFEDVVIFCLDMERCLARLNSNDQQLIKRIALQEYTQQEAAGLLGLSLRDVIRRYGQAVDRLTRILLDGGLLENLQRL